MDNREYSDFEKIFGGFHAFNEALYRYAIHNELPSFPMDFSMDELHKLYYRYNDALARAIRDLTKAISK